MKFRHRSAATAAALCAMLLSTTALAVAASADSSPLRPTSSGDKFEILVRQSEDERARFARRYPSVDLPDMTPMRVVPDDEWPDREAECLSGFGIEPLPRASAQPELNTSWLPREIIHRTCRLRYPKQSELRSVLGPFELRRLWAYHVSELQPCLRDNGVDIDAPPTLAEFLAARSSVGAWHPYEALTRVAGLSEFEYLDRRCPPYPGWLPR